MTRKWKAAHASTGGRLMREQYSTVSRYDKQAFAIGMAALAALFIVPRIIGAVLGVV